ncbi:MAG: hypothetical protein ATN36_01570 [Epulopiscium sp. Nele67-Bin005]|nr:MAG: hypothetical protein ATN36_01570 [Epulopiscium sp. Nele67-Bin005]
MICESYKFINPKDNHKIAVYKWYSKTQEIKGVIHIVHGASEHAKRYQHFARFLVSQGYVVFAHDHRGHGHSISKAIPIGDFGGDGGFLNLISDTLIINQHIQKSYPHCKMIMIGHSMGSFVARYFTILFSDKIDKLILSGTGYQPPALLNASILVINAILLVTDGTQPNTLINKIMFGPLNRKFLKENDRSAWLSRCQKERETFNNDKLCGQQFTGYTYRELVRGMHFINQSSNFNKILTKNLPILIISGEYDPVGNYGKGVLKTYKLFKQTGCTNVTLKIYPKMRHEIFNEINKSIVYKEIIRWLN